MLFRSVPLGIPLHPTQIYEAIAEFVIFGLLWQRAGWKLGPGAQIGFYLVMYSLVRFGVEFVRSHAQGLVAGLSLTQWMSLGFVVETEQQVEAHLQSHMQRLPENDQASRAIVAQMKADEMRHAQEAQSAGAVELPAPIKGLMRVAAKVMTTVAHRI